MQLRFGIELFEIECPNQNRPDVQQNIVARISSADRDMFQFFIPQHAPVVTGINIPFRLVLADMENGIRARNNHCRPLSDGGDVGVIVEPRIEFDSDRGSGHGWIIYQLTGEG